MAILNLNEREIMIQVGETVSTKMIHVGIKDDFFIYDNQRIYIRDLINQ